MMHASKRFRWRSVVGFWRDRLMAWRDEAPSPASPSAPVPTIDRLPLYVTAEGATVRLDGERLSVAVGRELILTAPLGDISEVVLIGPVAVTTPCLHALLAAEVPVIWCSMSGWVLGHTSALDAAGVERRRAQYRTADDPSRTLDVARALVAAKLHGQRLILRRGGAGHFPVGRLERLM